MNGQFAEGNVMTRWRIEKKRSLTIVASKYLVLYNVLQVVETSLEQANDSLIVNDWYKLHGTFWLVTKFFPKDKYSHDIVILLQPVNLLTSTGLYVFQQHTSCKIWISTSSW